VKDEMSSPVPPQPDRRGAKKMLTLFAAVAIVGVLMLAFSVVIGLVLLVIAEVFFAIAYRRFSRGSSGAR
jgi:hypothetical protein